MSFAQQYIGPWSSGTNGPMVTLAPISIVALRLSARTAMTERLSQERE
jgi:hypothetical protein